jgi:hypothetical protein
MSGDAASVVFDHAGRPVVMNSRMGRALPDVEPDDSTTTRDILAVIETLGAGQIDADAFHAGVMDILRRVPAPEVYARFLRQATETRADAIMFRKSRGGRDWQMQVIHIADGEVHPPHGHHNVISVQAVLGGTLHVREYDRLARAADDEWTVRPLVDQVFHPGEAMQTTDARRNVHWFAAVGGTALMLNLNIRGFETDTFYPRDAVLGRRLLDPTIGLAPDAPFPTLRARVLDPAHAYAKFAGRPLSDFPMPCGALPKITPARIW